MCGLFLPLTVICKSDGARGIPRRSLLPPQRCHLKIPALAERTEDIPLLANHRCARRQSDINRLSARSLPMRETPDDRELAG